MALIHCCDNTNKSNIRINNKPCTDKYKTYPCMYIVRNGICNNKNCNYAHTINELRIPNNKRTGNWKKELYRNKIIMSEMIRHQFYISPKQANMIHIVNHNGRNLLLMKNKERCKQTQSSENKYETRKSENTHDVLIFSRLTHKDICQNKISILCKPSDIKFPMPFI